MSRPTPQDELAEARAELKEAIAGGDRTMIAIARAELKVLKESLRLGKSKPAPKPANIWSEVG